MLTSLLLLAPLAPQEMSVLDPARSGIPGEEVRFVRVGPDQRIWVGARWPFWGDGGIGILDPLTNEWEVLSSAEGDLPSQFVNDLEFAADGSAWVATGGGLVHLADGESTLWNSSNSPMTLDVVNDLSIAPDGRVWFNSSTSSSGGDAVYAFDGATGWERFEVPTDIPFAAPWTDLAGVFADSQGRVWVANETLFGIARYEDGVWTLLADDVAKFEDIAEDSAGNLWITTNLVGSGFEIFRYDGQSLKSYPIANATTVRVDPEDDTIWVPTWNGQVHRSTDGGETFEVFLSGLNISLDVAPDPTSDELWVGTIGAVGRFDGNGVLLEDRNSYNTGMPWYWVEDFATDPRGNFWLATNEAGLSRFDGRAWRNFGAHNLDQEAYPFGNNEPMGAVFEDSQGRTWMGGNGIALWNAETGASEGFWNWQNNPGMGVTNFVDFAEDAQGDIFAAAEFGTIFRFDEGTQLWVAEPVQPYAVLGLPGMQTDANGKLWVVAWFDVWFRDNGQWSKVALPHNDYFFDLGGIMDFALAPDGTFLFGTVEGLVTWDGTTFTTLTPSDSPLPAPMVPGVAVREDGLIGLCSRFNGITLASTVCLVDGPLSDPSSWTVYEWGNSPLPHWQTEACAFDPTGDLWVSTLSEGVAIVDTGFWDDLGLALDGAAGDPYLKGYGVPTGGASLGLEVTRLAPGTIGAHVVGTSALMLPLFGGTLVPDPVLELAYVSDASGTARAEFTWPSPGPSGVSLWFQSWSLDPGAPLGVSASNALVLTVE